jgi:hypothetical protein
MLLRDEEQMALNDIETRCIEAADHYKSAAQVAGVAPAAPLFRNLAQRRAQLAADLALHIRALGDLPQTPDPDRELFGDMLMELKALFSADAARTLIDERLASEQAIVAAIASARRLALPNTALLTLDRIEADVRMAQRQLAAARDGDPTPGPAGPADPGSAG